MGRKAANKPDGHTPAAKLRALIEARAKGRPHYEIARSAGLATSKISQILTGQIKNPGVLTIAKILGAIGADFCDYERARPED